VTWSAQLRAATAGTWDAAVRHRFVEDIWRGAVPVPVLRTYLVQDHQFLDAFVALMGAAVAAADRAGPRIVHARRIGLVAGPENDYFARALDALDVPLTDRTDPELLPPTAGFLELMDSARRSADYARCVAVLLVAEWVYLDWATRPGADAPEDLLQREWIDLHRGPDFEGWVGFLRGELDRVAPQLDEPRRAQVEADFRAAAELELAFFDAAYDDR
jgi:thiaminase/transcriptional activator TenA